VWFLWWVKSSSKKWSCNGQFICYGKFLRSQLPQILNLFNMKFFFRINYQPRKCQIQFRKYALGCTVSDRSDRLRTQLSLWGVSHSRDIFLIV
jgi:hypothetical protein